MTLSAAPVLLRPFFRWREFSISTSSSSIAVVEMNSNRVALNVWNGTQFPVSISTNLGGGFPNGFVLDQRGDFAEITHAKYGPIVGEAWRMFTSGMGPWEVSVFELIWEPNLAKI